MTINVEKGVIVLHLGLQCVNVKLQPHLYLQNNAKKWRGHLVRIMMNVEWGAFVISGKEFVCVNLHLVHTARFWKGHFARLTCLTFNVAKGVIVTN
jgi:hypothetical protein